MPAPNRTTNDEILAAARSLLDEGGIDALTMHAVADKVGVRAPSLYKRVASRDELVGQVVESGVLELADVLDPIAEDAGEDPVEGLVALARELRDYAHRYPNLFALAFAPSSGGMQPSQTALERSSAAVLLVCERLAGRDRALDAARTVTAWAFGFVTMELSGAFHLGGDPAGAYDFGATAIARAIDARRPARS